MVDVRRTHHIIMEEDPRRPGTFGQSEEWTRDEVLTDRPLSVCFYDAHPAMIYFHDTGCYESFDIDNRRIVELVRIEHRKYADDGLTREEFEARLYKKLGILK